MSKHDRYVRSHDTDRGYELGRALVVDAADGRPLGPKEFRLRTADGMLSTRHGGAAVPPGHVDELDDVMAASRRWGLGRTPIHVIDREADSVGHYRRWQAAGHAFVVRANRDRVVLHEGHACKLGVVDAALTGSFTDGARHGGPARDGHDPGRHRDDSRRRGDRGPAPAGATLYRREDRQRP